MPEGTKAGLDTKTQQLGVECQACASNFWFPIPTEPVPDDEAGFADPGIGPMRVPIANGKAQADCPKCGTTHTVTLPSGRVEVA